MGAHCRLPVACLTASLVFDIIPGDLDVRALVGGVPCDKPVPTCLGEHYPEGWAAACLLPGLCAPFCELTCTAATIYLTFVYHVIPTTGHEHCSDSASTPSPSMIIYTRMWWCSVHSGHPGE